MAVGWFFSASIFFPVHRFMLKSIILLMQFVAILLASFCLLDLARQKYLIIPFPLNFQLQPDADPGDLTSREMRWEKNSRYIIQNQQVKAIYEISQSKNIIRNGGLSCPRD